MYAEERREKEYREGKRASSTTQLCGYIDVLCDKM